jgi:monoamine oxidase
MPASGSPLVRRLRRLGAAYRAFPGTPPVDPMEVLGWYESRLDTRVAEVRDAPAMFSRRRFLRGGAAVGAGAIGASVLGWSGARRARAGEANVVVVGAGLAGLSCAYRLARNGVACSLYEAQSRIGGRCWTIRVFDNEQTAEHGGQFVDTRHHQLRGLADRLGVGLIDSFEQSIPSGDQSYLWLDGKLRNPDRVFADFGILFQALARDYERVGPYLYDRAGLKARVFDRMSVVDYLDEVLPGGSTSLLGRAIERSNTGFWGLDGVDLSAINLFEFYVAPYPGANERYRVAGGNDTIPQRLAEELPPGTLRLERPLEAAWTQPDGRIGLRFAGEPVDVVADVVVFALPFTVLRDLDTSGLLLTNRRRRAIDELAMGTNAKLQFQLDRSLVDLGWTGGFGSDEPEYGTWDSTWGQTSPAPETPIITIYTGGASGAGYPTDVPHDVAPDGIVQSALDALARGVDGIHDAYNGIAYLDSWVDDPWVHGSYAGFNPGQYTRYWGYLGTQEANMVFVGEHTSTHSQGYLNGGVESGLRGANQVLATLGVDALLGA